MTTFENLNKAQNGLCSVTTSMQSCTELNELPNKKIRGRAALYRDVKSICTETCHFLGLDVTKPAMEIVAELVYKKISVYGTDLEAFAKHAKRSTINDQDVKLLVRRNPSLVDNEERQRKRKAYKTSFDPFSLEEDDLEKARLDALAPDSAKKDKRRKTVVPVTRVVETPAKSATPDQPSASKPVESDKDEEMDVVQDDAIDLTFDD